MKNPDEIMAEYLLQGAKMLAKECETCGSPLFEYKGEEICVVCLEAEKEKTQTGGVPPEEIRVQDSRVKTAELETELELTLKYLCERVRSESRPDDCLVLMECIEEGVEALVHLKQKG